MFKNEILFYIVRTSLLMEKFSDFLVKVKIYLKIISKFLVLFSGKNCPRIFKCLVLVSLFSPHVLDSQTSPARHFYVCANLKCLLNTCGMSHHLSSCLHFLAWCLTSQLVRVCPRHRKVIKLNPSLLFL